MERYRMTLVLLAALVVLGGVAFFLSNRNQTSSSASPTPVPQKYVWKTSGDVDAIDVVSGTKQVSLRKDVTTTVWTIISPVKETADPTSVGSEADLLKDLQATQIITNAGDLSQYGLAGTVMTTTVSGSSSPTGTHTLEIGKTTLDGSGYYTKLSTDNKTVYVVSNSTIEPLRTWLTTPPKLQPTPTPIPMTVVPTPTITPTPPPTSPTATRSAASPTPGSSTVITGSTTITSTAPGAANPTTPVATPLASPTSP